MALGSGQAPSAGNVKSARRCGAPSAWTVYRASRQIVKVDSSAPCLDHQRRRPGCPRPGSVATSCAHARLGVPLVAAHPRPVRPVGRHGRCADLVQEGPEGGAGCARIDRDGHAPRQPRGSSATSTTRRSGRVAPTSNHVRAPVRTWKPQPVAAVPAPPAGGTTIANGTGRYVRAPCALYCSNTTASRHRPAWSTRSKRSPNPTTWLPGASASANRTRWAAPSATSHSTLPGTRRSAGPSIVSRPASRDPARDRDAVDARTAAARGPEPVPQPRPGGQRRHDDPPRGRARAPRVHWRRPPGAPRCCAAPTRRSPAPAP